MSAIRCSCVRPSVLSLMFKCDKHKEKPKSNCCKAPAKIIIGEGISFWECTHCKMSCDTVESEEPKRCKCTDYCLKYLCATYCVCEKHGQPKTCRCSCMPCATKDCGRCLNQPEEPKQKATELSGNSGELEKTCRCICHCVIKNARTDKYEAGWQHAKSSTNRDVSIKINSLIQEIKQEAEYSSTKPEREKREFAIKKMEELAEKL